MKKFILLLIAALPIVALGQKAQIDLPITWDDTSNVDYTVTPFEGNSSYHTMDPMNSMNHVLASFKDTSLPGPVQPWAGTTLSTDSGLVTPIPFIQGSTFMSCAIYSPTAGLTIRLKVEDHTDPTISVETETMTTVANAWDTLVFDFANNVSGTTPIDFTKTYDKISIFFDFNNAANLDTFYLDDVFFGGTSTAPSTYNVTFKVDMNNYTGSYTTPEVNGTFNGWCGSCNPLTDSDGDNIWETTLPLTEDSIEFKFSADNWNIQESLTPGTACTKTANGFTNRFMHLSKDTVLEAVCWESCNTCGGSANVTFMIDLTTHTGSYSEVNLNGTFNNWCGNCAKMTDMDNDSIYELTLTVPTSDTIEYKFTLDGWNTQEQLTDGASCTMTTTDSTGTFTNRYLLPMKDTTLPAVCWEACVECNKIGLDENNWLHGINIFPNPSSGVIELSAYLDNKTDITITIFDIQGKQVYNSQETTSQLTKKIDLAQFGSGLYMVNFTSINGRYTEKVMITE